MECAAVRKITFTRAWRSYRKGQTVEISGGLATQLIAQRVATADHQQTLIETAAVKHEAETADATPKRRRRAVPKPDSSDASGG